MSYDKHPHDPGPVVRVEDCRTCQSYVADPSSPIGMHHWCKASPLNESAILSYPKPYCSLWTQKES